MVVHKVSKQFGGIFLSVGLRIWVEKLTSKQSMHYKILEYLYEVSS